MDCKEFEQLIPAFINQELNYKTLMRFNDHIDSCSECREELTIQILVTEGMARLEEGNSFDLQMELDKRLVEARKKVRFHKSFLYVGIVLEILAMLAIAGIVIWILLL